MTDNSLLYVDSSDNNGTPNLKAYAGDGHTRISFKVSEGTGYYWPSQTVLSDQAHRLRLEVDHYHWLTPNVDAVAQADWFVNHIVGHLAEGDRLMTDLERSDGLNDVSDAHRADQLTRFTARVKATIPIQLEQIVYAPDWYLDDKPLCVVECRKWGNVASNYDPITVLPNPHGLHRVAWQFSQSARVAGFAGPVDLNRSLIQEDNLSNFTDADLIAFAKAGALQALTSVQGEAAITRADQVSFRDHLGHQVSMDTELAERLGPLMTEAGLIKADLDAEAKK